MVVRTSCPGRADADRRFALLEGLGAELGCAAGRHNAEHCAHHHCIPDFPKAIRAWTINDEEEMAKCQELKIDGIITDFPEKALRWKQSTKSR